MEEARRFNEANGLRMIVRSHELVRRGWAVGGRKDVITIFSAADYRGTGNDGAVSFCWRARPASLLVGTSDVQHQQRQCFTPHCCC